LREAEDGYAEQEEEDDDYGVPESDEPITPAQNDRSRYIFALMSFLVALIFFSTYLNNFYDLLSGWLPLLGTVAFGAIGVLFLVPNSILNRTKSAESNPSISESDHSLREADTSETVDSFVEGEDAEEAELSSFELLVEEALDSIPAAFHEKMENVRVHVQYEPDQDVMRRVGIKAGYTLLGLYEGVPLTAYGQPNAPHPEIITIYQHSIEAYCHGKPDRIREQVRHTVLHEVAHHFGIDHEEMPIWIQ
jgi:predicted Zn-dependent protease with MMP-like domain